MRRISRKQRCTPAILSWRGILESGKYQGNGEHQDRRPRRQQNPRSRRRHPRDQRKLLSRDYSNEETHSAVQRHTVRARWARGSTMKFFAMTAPILGTLLAPEEWPGS